MALIPTKEGARGATSATLFNEPFRSSSAAICAADRRQQQPLKVNKKQINTKSQMGIGNVQEWN